VIPRDWRLDPKKGRGFNTREHLQARPAETYQPRPCGFLIRRRNLQNGRSATRESTRYGGGPDCKYMRSAINSQLANVVKDFEGQRVAELLATALLATVGVSLHEYRERQPEN
jgi:hypothetical protein